MHAYTAWNISYQLISKHLNLFHNLQHVFHVIGSAILPVTYMHNLTFISIICIPFAISAYHVLFDLLCAQKVTGHCTHLNAVMVCLYLQLVLFAVMGNNGSQ